MKESFQLREAFNAHEVKKLAKRIKKAWSAFDEHGFSHLINSTIDSLNFGERLKLISNSVKIYLPDNFPKAVDILIHSLEPELTKTELTGFDGFITWPLCDFVAEHGLNDYDISMNVLYEMTKRFSSEGAIRPFIEKYPQKTLKLLSKWTQDSNCHVRRLVSEGTRPRLPLYSRLPQFQKDPAPVIQLLEKLKDDPELYVRRSVANNLNDISKDNPDIVVATLKKWNKADNQDMQWIIRHALRTLLKQGNKEALALLGYTRNPKVSVKQFKILFSDVRIGNNLVFDFQVSNLDGKVQNLMIDYVIHFVKANGKLAPKVFKLTKKKIKAGEVICFTKKHSFRVIGIRPYYSGEHGLELKINGDSFGRKKFNLI